MGSLAASAAGEKANATGQCPSATVASDTRGIVYMINTAGPLRRESQEFHWPSDLNSVTDYVRCPDT